MRQIKSMALFVSFVAGAGLAGCASSPEYAPAKLECTGVCSVGGKQATSKCKAQSVRINVKSFTNPASGQTKVRSSAYTPPGVFRDCLNGEGWEYFLCTSEQEEGCNLVKKDWISYE